MGMRSNNTGGEIVQVEGGHIVRSTGRKDRHSKVYTSKGPRDRRVRLSAHTAIEFYDVQDRLGYDRPSKAVDWLIKKAKTSIDKLAELPPWHPISEQEAQDDEEEKQNNNKDNDMANTSNIGEQSESSNGYNFHHSAFIAAQQQIETDPIANFFPTTSTNLNSSINFQNYPHDIISARTNNPTEDNILGLSLQSFQQAGGGGGANQAPSSNEHHQSTLFADRTTNVGGFEGHHFQKIMAWNTQEAAPMEDNMNRVGGFMVNSQPFLGHQKGTLQSSSPSLFSPSLRSWSDINPMNSSNSSEHHRSQQQQIHQASTFGSRFLSDGLSGFCIPARIQGEEENHGHGVASNNSPSSASPNSHH